MALRLFAVCSRDALSTPLPAGASLVECRGLAAIVGEAPYAPETPTPALIDVHREVVDAAFAKSEVLPAPPGTIFRTPAAVERWMDLHYVTLSDGLAFVADRVAARVHVTRAEGIAEEADAGAGLTTTAAEVMRTLRRRAVAAVPLDREHATGIALGTAFLVERSLWREFLDEADAVREAHQGARISVTGPWPPYDFVRIEFGS